MSPTSQPAPAPTHPALARLAALGRLPSGQPTTIDHARQQSQPSAAVLVALFVGRSDKVYVLLSRRSKQLRGYPGDTALPGGKVDPVDVTFEDTARREAHEEIGLARDPDKVVFLAQGEDELSREGMVVTPILVWIQDKTLIPDLNPDEVAEIFALPLDMFLTSISPFGRSDNAHAQGANATKVGGKHYEFKDIDFTGRRYRRHQFLTNRESLGIAPVRGLTAAILINAATQAFGRAPDFQRYADPVKPNSEGCRSGHAVATSTEGENELSRAGKARL